MQNKNFKNFYFKLVLINSDYKIFQKFCRILYLVLFCSCINKSKFPKKGLCQILKNINLATCKKIDIIKGIDLEKGWWMDKHTGIHHKFHKTLVLCLGPIKEYSSQKHDSHEWHVMFWTWGESAILPLPEVLSSASDLGNCLLKFHLKTQAALYLFFF